MLLGGWWAKTKIDILRMFKGECFAWAILKKMVLDSAESSLSGQDDPCRNMLASWDALRHFWDLLGFFVPSIARHRNHDAKTTCFFFYPWWSLPCYWRYAYWHKQAGEHVELSGDEPWNVGAHGWCMLQLRCWCWLQRPQWTAGRRTWNASQSHPTPIGKAWQISHESEGVIFWKAY